MQQRRRKTENKHIGVERQCIRFLQKNAKHANTQHAEPLTLLLNRVPPSGLCATQIVERSLNPVAQSLCLSH